MLHRLILCLVAGVLMAAAGCGPNPAGKVPTSLPIQTFQPPDEDEVFPDGLDGQNADADEDGGSEE